MTNHPAFTPQRWWWLMMAPMVASAWVRDLWAPDEPRYAEVAREVWEGSSFVVMHLCGQVYPDKPPLLFWLSGLAGRLSNWSEFWMRFPSLAATLGSAFLIGRLAQRWWGERVAPWAAAVFLSMAMVTEIGGRLQIDPLLSFLCLLSLELILRPSHTGGQRTRHLLAAGLCVGLGGLAKGPAALANVGLILLAWRVFAPHEKQPKVAWPVWLGAAALAVGPMVGWMLLAIAREPALADELFFNQHLGRITKADRHPGPIWKHLVRFPLLLLPWTGAVVGGLRQGYLALTRPDNPDHDRNFVPAVLWIVVLVLAYSIIPPKRDLYLLLAYPAAALVGAAFLVSRFDGRRVSNWVTLPGPLLIVAAGLVMTASPWITDQVPGLSWQGPAVGLSAVFGGAWTMAALRTKGLRGWMSSLLVTWVTVGTLTAVLLFELANPLKSARGIARDIAARPERPAEIPCVGVRPEGYRFYGDGSVPTTTRHDLASVLEAEGADFLALIHRDHWRKIAPSLTARVRVIAEYRVGDKRMVLVGASLTRNAH